MKTYRVTVEDDKTVRWYNKSYQLHREDGPAMEFSNGAKHWYQNGQLHRKDGPAVEFYKGNKSWYKNGQLHREDGPAIEHTDGDKFWYLNGVELTEDEFNQRAASCDGKIVEMDGKKYTLKLAK